MKYKTGKQNSTLWVFSILSVSICSSTDDEDFFKTFTMFSNLASTSMYKFASIYHKIQFSYPHIQGVSPSSHCQNISSKSYSEVYTGIHGITLKFVTEFSYWEVQRESDESLRKFYSIFLEFEGDCYIEWYQKIYRLLLRDRIKSCGRPASLLK